MLYGEETVANGPHLIALERRPHEHHRTHGRHNIICSQLLSLHLKTLVENMLISRHYINILT